MRGLHVVRPSRRLAGPIATARHAERGSPRYSFRRLAGSRFTSHGVNAVLQAAGAQVGVQAAGKQVDVQRTVSQIVAESSCMAVTASGA